MYTNARAHTYTCMHTQTPQPKTNLPRQSAETPCSLGFEPQNPRYIHLRHSPCWYFSQVRMFCCTARLRLRLNSPAFVFDTRFVLLFFSMFVRKCSTLQIGLVFCFFVLDHRPQTAAGWVPENCAGAGGRAGTEATWLWQKAPAGQVQNWKCTGENAEAQTWARLPMAAWTNWDFIWKLWRESLEWPVWMLPCQQDNF